MSGLVQDLRYGLRQLRKSPGFTIAAVLTLAVAIGANAVVFAALDALVLRPLNVPHAENLFEVGRAGNNGNESYPNYVDLRDRNQSFKGLAATAFAHDGLDTGDGAEGAWGFATSSNYFDVLDVQPYLGRVFHVSDEHGPNSAPYIVLSYAYWQNHFHGNRNVLGRTVLLSKHPSPRHIAPSVQISRIGRTCLLSAKSYVAYHAGTGFSPGHRVSWQLLNKPSRS
jgi:MacB-like periplasmic core domain